LKIIDRRKIQGIGVSSVSRSAPSFQKAEAELQEMFNYGTRKIQQLVIFYLFSVQDHCATRKKTLLEKKNQVILKKFSKQR
jgi:hypothetical protein